MPFKFVNELKNFKWITTASGQPVGDVIHLGAGRWLTVCPLCGMTHDVTSVSGDEYQPTCEIKVTHPTVFASWRHEYSDAAQHTIVYLHRPDVPMATVLDRPQVLERMAG